MSRQINQPINQVRLTNVAVVRYNYQGKRFEIACYRNKILDFRAGLETDLSEVLQTDRVFTNVSKGQFAKSDDLQKVFHTTNEEDIARVILEKGQMQVSHLEREQLYDNTMAQIATWVANNCISSQTDRPFSVHQIQQSLQAYPLQPHKPIKKQCLDAFRYLQTVLPIQRAKMEVCLEFAEQNRQQVDHTLEPLLQETNMIMVVSEGTKTNTESPSMAMILRVDPSYYRNLNDLAKAVNGRLEILQQVLQEQHPEEEQQEREGQPEHVISSQASRTKQNNASQDTVAVTDPHHDYHDSDDDDPFIAKQLEAIRLHHGEQQSDNKLQDLQEESQQDNEASEKYLDGKKNEGIDSDSGSEDSPPQVHLTRKELRKQKKANRKHRKDQHHDHDIEDEEDFHPPTLTRMDGEANDDEENDDDSDDSPLQAHVAKKTQRKQQKKKANRKQRLLNQQQQKSVGDNISHSDDAINERSSSMEAILANLTATTGASERQANLSAGGTEASSNADGKSCNTCGGNFTTPAAYRAHFKTDWHRFNLKLKLKGITPVSEREFELSDQALFEDKDKLLD